MDKHIKQLILVAGLATLVLWPFGGYVQAQETSEGPSFNKEEMKEKWKAKKEEMYKELGITPEQAEQLKAQKEKHREGVKGLFEEIKARRQALGEELQKEEIDLDAVRKIHNDLKALNAQKEDKRLEGILEAREILTPEQFAQMMQFREQHGKKWRKFKGSHKGEWRQSGEAPAETEAE